MISYYDGQLTDIMPGNITKKPEVKALSYALQQACRLLYRYSQRLYIYTDLDRQPEEITDLLASELRTQYYRGAPDLATKQRLVKNTLMWHMSAGTPGAMLQLMQAVFGGGEVEEWFEYGGKPYCFRVLAGVDSGAEADIGEFIRLANSCKRLSAHMDALCFVILLPVPIHHRNMARATIRLCPQACHYPAHVTAGTMAIVRVRLKETASAQVALPAVFGYGAGLRPRIGVYGRKRLNILRLDGTWKLDGGRKLYAYCYGERDYFPVKARVKTKARAITGIQAGMCTRPAVFAGVARICPTRAHASIYVRGPGKGAHPVKAGASCGAMAAPQSKSAHVKIINRLDGTWKLDGGRKLDAGTYGL